MKLKKNLKFKAFSGFFVFVVFLTSTLFLFKDFKNKPIEPKDDLDYIAEVEKEALPYDFFGQYNHGEVWEVKYKATIDDEMTTEVIYGRDEVNELHNSEDWYYWWHEKKADEVTNGIGIKSFQNYTSMFHKAINKGYIPYYYNQGKYDLSEDPELDGFIGINPDWTLLNFAYYMEDWIVWNWNERLNNDPLIVATPENVSFVIYSPSLSQTSIELEELEENWENETFGENKLWGINNLIKDVPLNEEWSDIYIDFEEETLYNWTYDNVATSYSFNAPALENTILLSHEKKSIKNKFNPYIVHNKFRNNFYLETKFNQFRNEFEDYLIKGLNYEFIKEYGIEELGHDRNQGIYLTEDIRKDDLEINYYKSIDNNLFLINNLEDEKKLKDFNEIIVEIKTLNDSLIVEENETISIIFEPNKELNSNTTPLYNSDKNLLFKFLFLLILLSVVFFIVFFSKKEKSSKENENIN